MRSAESIKDWKRMHFSITDPEEKAKARRNEERRIRIKEKVEDYNL